MLYLCLIHCLFVIRFEEVVNEICISLLSYRKVKSSLYVEELMFFICLVSDLILLNHFCFKISIGSFSTFDLEKNRVSIMPLVENQSAEKIAIFFAYYVQIMHREVSMAF